MQGTLMHRLTAGALLLAMLTGTTAVFAAAPVDASRAGAALTFTPAADAYVTKSQPSTNFGGSRTLRADASPVTRSYVRFAVSGLNGAAIQSARLRVYANSANSTGLSALALSNNTWAESAITYQNAPAPGALIARSKSFSAGTWVEVDVTSYVKAQGTYSLVLSTGSSTNINLSSREAGASAPQLVVTTLTAPTATAAPSRTPTAIPTGTATAPPAGQSGWQPSFPIRAAFYYPWFPEAWKQNGIYPYTNYTPQLGYYSSADAATLKQHIAMMQYGNIQAGIASWWGQGSQTDSKIAGLLTAASGTNFRWTLYYEAESLGDPGAAQIQSDLTYIRDHYAGDPGFLRVNGKFVVFVYADGNDGCGMADRWKQGNTVGAYVVLKVFNGYRQCASQPDDWHQYSPAVAADQQSGYSYSISPGFWLVGQNVRLGRDLARWAQNVRDMAASGAKWQLITTFSEWGEGTAVEPALEWSSASGNGQYLDALHYNGNMP